MSKTGKYTPEELSRRKPNTRIIKRLRKEAEIKGAHRLMIFGDCADTLVCPSTY